MQDFAGITPKRSRMALDLPVRAPVQPGAGDDRRRGRGRVERVRLGEPEERPGIVVRSSSDWIRKPDGGWTRGEVKQTRVLNLNHDRTLKCIFKGAASG
jgi:hypothetical protein